MFYRFLALGIVRVVQLCMPLVASCHLCFRIIRCRQQTKYRRKAFTEVTALSQVEIAKDMAAAASRGDIRRVLWCIAHCDDMSIVAQADIKLDTPADDSAAVDSAAADTCLRLMRYHGAVMAEAPKTDTSAQQTDPDSVWSWGAE